MNNQFGSITYGSAGQPTPVVIKFGIRSDYSINGNLKKVVTGGVKGDFNLNNIRPSTSISLNVLNDFHLNELKLNKSIKSNPIDIEIGFGGKLVYDQVIKTAIRTEASFHAKITKQIKAALRGD